MSKNRRYQRRRNRLWREDPHCRFCGDYTRLPKDVPGAEDGNMKGPAPKMATLEHLDTRLDDNRGDYPPGEERTTLACKKCNERRAYERERELGIEELRRRSQQH